MTLILNNDEVERALDFDEASACLEDAYRELAEGRAVNRPTTQTYLPPGRNADLPGVRREKPRDWSRFPEIGDLVSGRARGRSRPDEITFFLNNIGTGVQFAALGDAVYRRSRSLGLGREVPTDWFLQDVKP